MASAACQWTKKSFLTIKVCSQGKLIKEGRQVVINLASVVIRTRKGGRSEGNRGSGRGGGSGGGILTLMAL